MKFLYVLCVIMIERSYDEWLDTQPEKIPESFREKIYTKVVLTLLKCSSNELFEKLISENEKDKSISEKILKIIILKHLNNSSDEEINAMIEDINHTCERNDGSSDGLEEALDIINNGFRECSNWNTDLHQIWKLEQLFPVWTTLTPDDEVKIFQIIWTVTYPEKTNLTWIEQNKVYKIMKKFLGKIKDLIKDLV